MHAESASKGNSHDIPILVQFLPKKNNNLIWFKLILGNKKKIPLFPVPANQPHYKAETMTI